MPRDLGAIEFRCPNCKRPGKLYRVKFNTPFICKACQKPFYLNETGNAVSGEPFGGFNEPESDRDILQSRLPAVDELEAIKEKLQEKLHEKLEKFSRKRIIAIAAAVLVVGMGLYYLLGPAKKLDEAAEKAGRALAEADLPYLKSIAASGTADDVAKWFDEVHPLIVQARHGWSGKPEVVDVHVVQEDRAERKGAVGVTIHPASRNARDVTLADPTEAIAAAAGPVDLATDWTLSKWGRWKLDGHATYARVHPNP